MRSWAVDFLPSLLDANDSRRSGELSKTDAIRTNVARSGSRRPLM
jgi:hypothetical protein